MKKNKKGIFYSILILIFTIFILIVGLSAVFKKTSNNEKIGKEQIELIRKYQEGEDTLFYIDQSAKYSIYNVVYHSASKGFYFNEQACKQYLTDSKEYTMWENILENGESVSCYPQEKEVVTNFALFFNNELDKYFEQYKITLIPKDNYDFSFKEDKKEVSAIATRDIIIESKNSFYSFKPSFKTTLPYNFISKFSEIVSKTLIIKALVMQCLEEGSGKPDDEDLDTCANIEELKKEIEDINSYQIKPVTEDKDYTLLFDIEDNSFENPYSDEKLIVRFGIRFADTFHPPTTEISGVKDGILSWKKNNASDVTKYKIYARSLEPISIQERDLITTTEGIEWKIQGLEKGEYYFYIVAVDNADNEAKDIKPKKLTI